MIKKGGGHKLDTICMVVGLMMLDAVVYLLLELLLVDYSAYYGQSSGSILLEEPTIYERLLYLGRYFWFAVNLLAILLITFRVITEQMKS